MKLILASASPRRKELIGKIEDLQVEIVPSKAEEITAFSDPFDCAKSLAELKATTVFAERGGTVLGADTIVVMDGIVMGKPRNKIEAKEMLMKLCGRTHEVITGLCIVNDEKKIVDAEVSFVTFDNYNEQLICDYISSGAPFDKAGGYGIQDEALKPIIKDVKGDLSNVIGLPVKKVEQLLKQFRR